MPFPLLIPSRPSYTVNSSPVVQDFKTPTPVTSGFNMGSDPVVMGDLISLQMLQNTHIKEIYFLIFAKMNSIRAVMHEMSTTAMSCLSFKQYNTIRKKYYSHFSKSQEPPKLLRLMCTPHCS